MFAKVRKWATVVQIEEWSTVVVKVEEQPTRYQVKKWPIVVVKVNKRPTIANNNSDDQRIANNSQYEAGQRGNNNDSGWQKSKSGQQ